MGRLFEIDFLRGLAVVLMVVFNWSFTLRFLDIFTIDGGWLYWWLFPRVVGGLFVFLAGLSIVLSYNRVKDKSRGFIYKKYLLRGGKIFSIGLGITVVTWLSFPSYTIWFGILHLIGVSIVLSVLFFRFRRLLLIAGLAILFFGFYFDTLNFNFSNLLWLGLKPLEFQTFDHWPLLPWFGLFLVGMFVGKIYAERRTNLQMPVLKGISFLGRHSLIAYIIHQPLLILVLQLLGFNFLSYI